MALGGAFTRQWAHGAEWRPWVKRLIKFFRGRR